MSVRVSVVQTRPAFGKPAENVAAALALMEETPADVHVLPELAMTGYNFSDAGEVAALAEEAEGPTFRALRDFAARKKAWVAYGFVEKTPAGLYNAAAIAGPAGVAGLYRKAHLFDREKLFFKPGDLGLNVFDLPFGRAGLMICFDWYFPETARTLALKGAAILLHPSNLVLPNCPDAMITRCLENRVFAATANRVGVEPGGDGPLTYIGLSQIVNPRGERLARLGREDAGAAAAACDLALAGDKGVGRSHLFDDRRPEFYAR